MGLQPSVLIFDLGGVIIDLDVDRTINRFAALFETSYEQTKEAYTKSKLFADFETGKIEAEAFRMGMRSFFNRPSLTDQHLDEAWNAMLVGLPKEKLDLLLRLKETHAVYILSNTNEIHIEYINRNMFPGSYEHPSFDRFVHKAYYSHELGLRKPDPEIYQSVVRDIGVDPKEIVFFDDNPENVGAAQKAGIQAIQIHHPDDLYTYFN